MNRVVIGILAHVDSGKTTISEGMLYSAGEIRKIGRVDHGDAFSIHTKLNVTKALRYFQSKPLCVFVTPNLLYLTLPVTLTFLPKWSVL